MRRPSRRRCRSPRRCRRRSRRRRHSTDARRRRGSPTTSPSRAIRTPMAPSGHRREVVGVVGLAQLEHHVVRHVDHVVDRSHAGGEQALAQPGRRRPEANTRDDPGHEPSAQVGVDHVDRRQGRRLGSRTRSRPARAPRTGRPAEAARSRATPSTDRASGRFGLTSMSNTQSCRMLECLADRGPERQVGVENQDAGVVVAEAELAGRAQHSVAHLAPHLAGGDLHAVGHHRARPSRAATRSPLTMFDAPHATWSASPSPRSTSTRRILSALGCARTSSTRATTMPSRPAPTSMRSSHLESERAQLVGDLGRLTLDGGELAEPGQDDLHQWNPSGSGTQNCSRNRASLVTNSRRSSTL